MSFTEELHYQVGKKDQDLKFIIKKDKFTAYVILDGHGHFGREFVHRVEYIVYKKLASLNDAIITYETVLRTLLNDSSCEITECVDDFYKDFLNRLFIDTDKELEDVKFTSSGCTMSIVLITNTRMYVANVGDSDVALYNKETGLTKLTTEHSGLVESEMVRLKLNPCIEIFYISNEGQLALVWNEKREKYPIIPSFNYLVNEAKEPVTYISYVNKLDDRWPIIKSICISRSIGDYFFKTTGAVISEPSISIFNKPSSNDLLLIGSDGFWDAWTPENLHFTLYNEPSLLFSKSVELNEKAYNVHKDDNSLILVKFH
jgi:serine/threonine protein phosphatase PrpC